MVNMAENQMIVGLDVGTSTVVCIVAELAGEDELEIIGIGSHPSQGLKKGMVINIESTVQSIQRAVEEAELMAGCEIHSVYAGIADNYIRSINSHGIVAIRDREVLQSHVDRVVDAAKAVAVPADQKVLHVLPQEYIIDSQDKVINPLGMSGVRLEATVHLVTCAVNALQNLEKCIRRCSLEVEDVILDQLAAGQAVLSDDEKDLGVCLVDIGGGTTDIAVYVDGAIKHTNVIPVAGDQVTNDIAMALRTQRPAAEEIKIKYACALSSLANARDIIKVPGPGRSADRELSRSTLADVVEPRCAELFALVQEEVRSSGYGDRIGAGIVLTGGTSRMEGIGRLAEEIFNLPVRIGRPGHTKGLTDMVNNPIYATSVGLLLHGAKKQKNLAATRGEGRGLFDGIRRWFFGEGVK